MTAIINALVSSAARNRSAPLEAETIIEKMEQGGEFRPDVVTYTSLIKCWSQSGRPRAATRAEEIIELLHQRYHDGLYECKPDSVAYNVALNAIAKSSIPDCAERAEAMLQRMQDHYHLEGDNNLAPTTESFATVMFAWSQSKDPKGPIRAEKLLQMMHDLHDSGIQNVVPNTIAYSTCILAWSKSGLGIAGERADALLKKMEEYHDEGFDDMKPNAISYTNAMEAWINSKQPNSLEKVEEILNRMIERSTRDPDSAPTTTSFNVALKAIRYSSAPMKHRKAEQRFSQMKEMYRNGNVRVKPNIQTYNQVSK